MDHRSYACRTAVYLNNAGITLLTRGHSSLALDCFAEAVNLFSFCCYVPESSYNNNTISGSLLLPLLQLSIENKLQVVDMTLAHAHTKPPSTAWYGSNSRQYVHILSLDHGAEHFSEDNNPHRGGLTMIRIEELPASLDSEHLHEILPACVLLNYAACYHLLFCTTTTQAVAAANPSSMSSLLWMKSTTTTTTMSCWAASAAAAAAVYSLHATDMLDTAMRVLNIRRKLCSKDWTSMTGSHLFVAVAILHMASGSLTAAERDIVLAAAGEIFRAAPRQSALAAAA